MIDRLYQIYVTQWKGKNLQIMEIEEEEFHAKGIENIFNKVIAENFLKL